MVLNMYCHGRRRMLPERHLHPPNLNRSRILYPQLRLRFERAEQIAGSEYAEKIILPLGEWENNVELIGFFEGQVVAELPTLCYDEDRLKERLLTLREKGLNEVQVDNIGALVLAKSLGLTVHGGAGLNILNTAALDEYQKMGLCDATVSFEGGGEKTPESLKSFCDFMRSI